MQSKCSQNKKRKRWKPTDCLQIRVSNTLQNQDKESTGFEPVHRCKPARWISSPVHYRSANSPWATSFIFVKIEKKSIKMYLIKKRELTVVDYSF